MIQKNSIVKHFKLFTTIFITIKGIRISLYHAIDVKIAFTRYEMMIAKHFLKFISSPKIELARHEAAQGKNSPKITKNCCKILEHHKYIHVTNPDIKIYIY